MAEKVGSVNIARAYHHGKLREVLLEVASALLEEGGAEALSLRAMARQAGVSPMAPYRHFADKAALLEAVAIHGFELLRDELTHADAGCGDDDAHALVEQGWIYVRFAVQRPHLFRLMFGRPATWQDAPDLARDRPGTAFFLFASRIRALVPPQDVDLAILTAWSAMHGFASLALDGRLGVRSEALEANARRASTYLVERLARGTAD